jgi:hypothetical protein
MVFLVFMRDTIFFRSSVFPGAVTPGMKRVTLEPVESAAV